MPDFKFGALDPTIDSKWANTYNDSKALHSYFDYYFSGQDIQVRIDGVETEIPVASLAYDVEQQKAPVYGFWDYTFSTIMRGTRIVTGVINIYTTRTDFMKFVLSEAALTRKIQGTKYAIRGLDADERLIEQYWGRNINDDTALSANGRNIFSSHPPFNLVIVYGIQSSSITGNGGEREMEIVNRYRTADDPLMSDINERLVTTDPVAPMRTVLENVELNKIHVEFQPDGSPLYESYTFFAREAINPRLDNNYNPKSAPPL